MITNRVFRAAASDARRGLSRSLCTAVASMGLLSASAAAQIAPDRLYNGVDRPFPVTVSVPDGATGDAKIHLYTHGAEEPVLSADVSKGRADLSALFPRIWTPEGGRPVLYYAQLTVGEEEIGPPVVLQPMVNPPYAYIDPADASGRRVTFRPTGNTYSGIRAYVEQHIVFETTMGEIEFRLRPDEAPNTAFNFRHLVEGGFYTDVVFHRIAKTTPSGDPFVVQVGDPTATGTGGPGYQVDLEQTGLQHGFGVLSMARSGDPNSNGSQVFVCLSRPGTFFLDGLYTAFGEAVRGAETILAIADAPVGGSSGQFPQDPKPTITRAFLVDAPSFMKRPERVTRPGEDDAGR